MRIVEWRTGLAWTWDLDVAHAIEFACAVAGRDFTAEEWRTHFGDRPRLRLCPV